VIEVAIAVVLGLCAGPFLRLAVDRVPDRLPLFGERPASGQSGITTDLAPVMSWASATTPGIVVPVGSPDDVEDGQARDTRVQRWRAPVIDLATVVVLVSLALRFGGTPADVALPAMFVFGASLVVVSVIDIDHFRIPDRIVFPSIVACGVLLIAASVVASVPGALFGALFGALAYFGFLFLFFLVSPRGMGFGDVKLALLLGMVLGWTGAVSDVNGVLTESGLIDSFRLILYGGLVGSVLGSVVGLGVIAARGRRAHFPFGPSLCIGTLLVVLFSELALG